MTDYDYRILELERDVRELREGVAPVPIHEQRLRTLEGGLNKLAEGVNKLTLAIIAGTITISASALGVIVTLVSKS